MFRMLEEGNRIRLVRQFVMEIPLHAQGISFLQEGGTELFALKYFIRDGSGTLPCMCMKPLSTTGGSSCGGG